MDEIKQKDESCRQSETSLVTFDTLGCIPVACSNPSRVRAILMISPFAASLGRPTRDLTPVSDGLWSRSDRVVSNSVVPQVAHRVRGLKAESWSGIPFNTGQRSAMINLASVHMIDLESCL